MLILLNESPKASLAARAVSKEWCRIASDDELWLWLCWEGAWGRLP